MVQLVWFERIECSTLQLGRTGVAYPFTAVKSPNERKVKYFRQKTSRMMDKIYKIYTGSIIK